MKELHAAAPENFNITKYFVKALSLYDEDYATVEPFQANENLELAVKLNKDILVGVHKNKKQTIKV